MTAPVTSPLRIRDFRRLLAARSISFIGDGISQVAVSFAVLEITHSASAVGLVLAARTVPAIAFMLFSGVWADRYSRRTLMVVSDAVCMFSQAALALMLLSGTANVVVAGALQAFYGFGVALFRPASSGMIRDVVPAESLQKANSLLGISNGISGAFGPSLGGVVVALASPASGLFLDAASFLASGILLYSIRASSRRVQVDRKTDMLAELRSGWRAFAARRWVVISVAYFALYQLFVLAPLYVLGPVVFSTMPHGPQEWGFLLTASGAGVIAGGMIAYRFTSTRILVVTYSALLLTALPLALIAVSAALPLIVISMVLFGAALAYGVSLWETTLQGNVPSELLGRISSYDWFGSTILRPVGFALVGPVAVLIGDRSTLAWSAAAGALATLCVLFSKDVRRVRLHPDPASIANAEPVK